VVLKAMGLDLRSSISATCSDLASLPDEDLCALFDLIEREIAAVRLGLNSEVLVERMSTTEELRAITHALRILGG
jgi:hypothetical protein